MTTEPSTPVSTVAADPVAGSAKPDPILVADQISRRFGGLRAVDVDHLEVERGTITAMIGPNGAGKTTFFNLLTGFDRPDTGTVRFNDRELSRQVLGQRVWMSPQHLASRGMVRTFQLTKVMNRMTVLQNMCLGAPDQSGESLLGALPRIRWAKRETEVTEQALSLLGHFNLAHMQQEYAGTLSGGQRKLLEMARALMTEPLLLMLDEPMAGVNPALTQSLLGHITDLRDRGVTVIFIEHDMDMVMEISDWVVCLAEGAILAEGPPAHVASDPEVVEAYLGSRHLPTKDDS